MTNGRYMVARLNANGSLDTTFGTGGFFTFDLTAIPASFALQSDGKIVVGASTFDSASASYRLVVARFNADGSLDVSFNTNGRILTTMKVESKAVAAIQTNGKIWAGGYVPTNLNQHFEAQRFDTNGTIDSSVGLMISTAIGGTTVPFYDFVLQSPNSDFNNKLTVVGGIADFNLFRTTDGNAGQLDATFGTGGRAATDLGNDFECAAAVPIESDGRIAAAGLTIRAGGSGTVFAVTRYYSGLAFPISKAAADFDGDGRADASVFRNGTWFINQSTNGFYATQFGLATDKLTPADFDGDGKTDVAVWREGAFSYFYVLQSAINTFRAIQFGTTGDNPSMVGDWDGDGKADATVYRGGVQGNFYYRPSSQAGVDFITVNWGTTGDLPMRGDFDGDGKTDPAVFRNGIWYIKQSSNNQPIYKSWGASTDALVPADYDGDGKTDVAVYRSGIYYILNAANTPTYVNFGAAGDVPIASASVQ